VFKRLFSDVKISEKKECRIERLEENTQAKIINYQLANYPLTPVSIHALYFQHNLFYLGVITFSVVGLF
jgi:hypothetical protein